MRSVNTAMDKLYRSGMPISHLITDDTFYHNDKSVSFERDKVIF